MLLSYNNKKCCCPPVSHPFSYMCTISYIYVKYKHIDKQTVTNMVRMLIYNWQITITKRIKEND